MDGAVYMKLFFSYGKTFDKLPDEDAGQLIKAMLHYAETGEAIPPESAMADLAFDFIKIQIDRDRKAFTDGNRGGRPKKETWDTENVNPPSENTKPPFPETETPVSENENHPSEKQEPYKGLKAQRNNGVINNNTDRVREEETPFGAVPIDSLIVKVQREIVGMTDTHYDLFRQYREDLGDELVSYAIDSAVAQGVRKWAYLETILCKYGTAKYRSVAEIKAAEEERKRTRAAPQKPPKTVTAQRFTQREYTDAQLGGEMSPLLANALRKVQEEDEGITGNVV